MGLVSEAIAAELGIQTRKEGAERVGGPAHVLEFICRITVSFVFLLLLVFLLILVFLLFVLSHVVFKFCTCSFI